MTPHITRFLFTALAVVGFASYAQAASVSLDNCDAYNCEGSTLFLEVTEVSGGFDVVYTIDTTGYTGDRLGMNQVGFKAIQGWTSGSVTLAPAGSINGSWDEVIEDSISANSLCSTPDNSDFVCTYGFVNTTEDPPGTDIRGKYTWNFHIVGGTLMDTSDWTLKGQYADGGVRTPGKVISVPVPEPTAALLFGLGAILVTRRAQRR
jgi:hypothetical protein